MNTQSVSWKKNLYIISIAEFFAIVGFCLFAPFMPLYLQKLGNLSTGETAFWSGIAMGGGGLALLISSPLWGMLADRMGRKPMLLRAQFGGAVTIILFLIAPNVYAFVGFRMVQGLFTGTVAAASALAASTTPREKLPLAMGILLGSVYAGTTIGPLIGGLLADAFGFTITFVITSILLAIGGLIILLFSRENFQPPDPGSRTSFREMFRLAFSPGMFPILMVVAALNLGPQIVQPVLPLVISELSSPEKAASSAGLALGLMGIITAISSVVVGRLDRRIPIRRILIISCIGTGLLYLPPFFANSTVLLIIFIGLMGLFVGGMVTSANSMVSLSVPYSKQGIAYGLSQSAMSLGAGIGPFVGGSLAHVMGLRPVFFVAAGVFLLVGVLCMKLIPQRLSKLNSRMPKSEQPRSG